MDYLNTYDSVATSIVLGFQQRKALFAMILDLSFEMILQGPTIRGKGD